MVSVSFWVLGTDSLEAALSHLDDELVSPAELICFVPDSFIMPVPRRLFEAWERHVPSEVQMEGSVTPREDGGWEFEDARERPSRAHAPSARAKRRQVRGDVAAPSATPCSRGSSRQRKRRTSRKFDSSSASGSTRSGRRMTALERGIPASGAGGSAAGGTAILGDPLGALRGAGPSQAGGTLGVLGVTAGPVDSAATLRDARAMLGRGT